jgi:hypothetical protein
LPALRETIAMGVLLGVHRRDPFITVMLPCSTFIHGIRRSVALLRRTYDRIASPIAEGSHL